MDNSSFKWNNDQYYGGIKSATQQVKESSSQLRSLMTVYCLKKGKRGEESTFVFNLLLTLFESFCIQNTVQITLGYTVLEGSLLLLPIQALSRSWTNSQSTTHRQALHRPTDVSKTLSRSQYGRLGLRDRFFSYQNGV